MKLWSLFLLLAACKGERPAPADSDPTWHGDVAPILEARCVGCHQAGGIGPFDLSDAATAMAMADALVESVEAGRMPPWLAQNTPDCSVERPWKDDLRLSAEELDTLRSWAEAGAPLGDPSHAAPLPEPPDLRLEGASQELTFLTPYTVQGEVDDFECFVLDPGLTEDVWVDGVEFVAGNAVVDHHALIMADLDAVAAEHDDEGHFDCDSLPDGYLMSAWVPGAVPMVPPAGTAMYLPAGARIVVQMHYHPSSTGPEQDQSMVRLRYSAETPEYAAVQVMPGNYDEQEEDGSGLQPGPADTDGPEFRIPAGAQGHTEEQIYIHDVDIDLPIFNLASHMHYVGTGMQVRLDRAAPEGDEPSSECLLETPTWNFNWQRSYAYDVPIEELPVVRKGDKLHLDCIYDNSLSNPFVAANLEERGQSAPSDVYLGESTTEEMCLGLIGVLIDPALVKLIY